MGGLLGRVWAFLAARWRRIERQALRLAVRVVRQGPVPKHVAFIMDGNRRFARQQRMARTAEGHVAGFDGLQATMEWCYLLGMEAITVYAFSIENFNRSPEEVGMLMSLAISKADFLTERSDLVRRYGARVRVIGELELLPEAVRLAAQRVAAATKDNTGPIINICFPYTSKAELTTTANRVLSGLASGASAPADLTVDSFSQQLYSAGSPPVDILVRTSGEQRLSEFLTWQVCRDQSQVEFLQMLWPEFRFWHFLPILARFQLRRLGAA